MDDVNWTSQCPRPNHLNMTSKVYSALLYSTLKDPPSYVLIQRPHGMLAWMKVEAKEGGEAGWILLRQHGGCMRAEERGFFKPWRYMWLAVIGPGQEVGGADRIDGSYPRLVHAQDGFPDWILANLHNSNFQNIIKVVKVVIKSKKKTLLCQNTKQIQKTVSADLWALDVLFLMLHEVQICKHQPSTPNPV